MLGHGPLSSRPLSDVAAQQRLAVLAVTEDDDTLVATATVLPLAGGSIRRRRPKRIRPFANVEPPAPRIHAVLRVTEDDDTLAATAAISLSARLAIFEDDDVLTASIDDPALIAAARRRRQLMQLLLAA